MQGGHTGCFPYCGAAEDAFCSSYWKTPAQALCSVHKASGVPVWSGSPWFSYKLSSCINILGRKMTECKYSTAKIQTTVSLTSFSSWLSSAGLCSKLVLTSSTALQVYSRRAEPAGGREREAVPLLDSPAFSACHMKWIKLVPRESLIKMPEVQLIC